MDSSDRRSRSLITIVLGLAIGVALGLVFGWVVWPIQYTEANPAILREDYRRDYALMIATVYAADGDLTAAQNRLAQLGPDYRDYLLEITTDLVMSGEDEGIVRPLAQLAADLGLSSPVIAPYLTE